MKILFINTTDVTGGAAIVMQRLMHGLQEQHATENLLLVKTRKGTGGNTKPVLSNKGEIILEKVIEKITRPLGLLYQYFPFSSKSILSAVKEFKPDIINLHNTHGAYFATPLLQKIAGIAPVVWTLHDMWSFTANASHTFGNMSWKYLKNDPVLKKIPPSIGINTGSYLLKQKKRIYRPSRLSVVTPSLWLKNLAEQSPVFEGKDIHHIYNGVPCDIYFPVNKQAARQKAGIPLTNKTIMFSSHFLTKNNPWKGGRDLLEILARLNASAAENINLLVLGEGTFQELDSFSNFNVYRKGYVQDEQVMRDLLNASDLFIYPTRADNLPNVLVESIACGTPCITFDIGGNTEIVKHNYNGIIIKPFDFDKFAQQTILLLNDDERLLAYSHNCLLHVKEFFSLNDMITIYYKLFQDITGSRN